MNFFGHTEQGAEKPADQSAATPPEHAGSEHGADIAPPTQPSLPPVPPHPEALVTPPTPMPPVPAGPHPETPAVTPPPLPEPPRPPASPEEDHAWRVVRNETGATNREMAEARDHAHRTAERETAHLPEPQRQEAMSRRVDEIIETYFGSPEEMQRAMAVDAETNRKLRRMLQEMVQLNTSPEAAYGEGGR